jgi:hypothetical protein
MGMIQGKMLATEKIIKQLRKQLKKDDTIPYSYRARIEPIIKMALRYIKLKQRLARVRKYKDFFPAIARGICKTFDPTDKELAACFSTNKYSIERWKALYPEFKKQILKGKNQFLQTTAWPERYKEYLADQISSIFNATDEQFAEFFDVDVKTFNIWKQKNEHMDNLIERNRALEIHNANEKKDTPEQE